MTIRGKKYLYYNEHTGRLIGRELLAYYNIEMPELLTVSDLKRQKYFSVKRIELPAMTATKEQFEEVNRARRAHMAPARAIFGKISHEVVSTITRDSDHSEEDKALGRFHNEEMQKAKKESGERGRKIRKLQMRAAAAGVEINGPVRDPDEALEAIDRREFWRKQLLEKEGAEEL